MSVNENGNLRPDGVSVSLPFPLGRIGGTYYWNPGALSAPHVTLSRHFGLPGLGLNAVFLGNGMTSQDTLGHGVSGNVSTGLPSVTVNGTIPDAGGYFSRFLKPKVTSIEAGIGTLNASPAETNTYTPQQIADFLNKYFFGPAAGPNDELSPFARSLQSGVGTIGPNNGEPPLGFLSPRYPKPLGNGIAGWTSSVELSGPQYFPQRTPSPDQPGGLPGMLLDYLRNNPTTMDPVTPR